MSMSSEMGLPREKTLNKIHDLDDLQVVRNIFEIDAGNSSLKYDTEWLDLSRSVIEEKETKIMARALESNRVVNLKVLFLHKNAGDVGMRAMLNALVLGYLHGLEKLFLWEVSSYDQITTAEEGTDAIADALGKGKAPGLHTLDLTGSLPKLTAPRKWKQVLDDLSKFNVGSGRLHKFTETCFGCLRMKTNSGRNQTLDCLRCQFFKVNVFSGDDGVRKIVRALTKYPLTSLQILNLRENYIGDTGTIALAQLLADGLLPKLEELDLQNNPVGKDGAETIVEAFLVNPLLTVRVKLDWPTLLLKERASAFRESNIRLEHRLVELKLKVEHGTISNWFRWMPAYYLQRPPDIRDYKLPHRLYVQCQAPGHDPDALSQGAGIQIKRRSCFGRSSRKYVDREVHELEEEVNAEEAPPSRDEGIPSWRTPTSSGSNRGSANVQGAGLSAYQTLSVTSTSGVTTDRGSVVGAQNSFNSQETPASNSSSTRESAKTSGRASDRSRAQDEKALKKHRGENHIYITAGSCGFIGAAKALGVQTKKGFWRGCYSLIRRTLQNRVKTQHHIYSIMEELLMVADRKPHEFQHMFDLRRVVLMDDKSLYYPAYICSTCYLRIETSGHYLQPIIHKALLDAAQPVSRSPQQDSPAPQSFSRQYPKHLPKFDRQPSRLPRVDRQPPRLR